ncbi:Endonuclease/exonuclease/phosphatase [Fomitopsis betulina]|nr:Endonuclease/exonuclease/phosphatase [Fomitopsis betulina]
MSAKMITKPIRVLQLNANRQNTVIHALLNSTTADDSADIILITEPWWGNIGNDTQGPVSETATGWTPILPVAPIKRGQRPRAMVYTRRRNDFTVTLRSDIANDLDLQVLEVAQATHPSTFLVNIYNDDKKQGRHSAAKRVQQLALPRDDPTIISGDWNLHHPLWSRSAEPANDSTEQTADWLATQGYTIKNVKGEPTFFSHTHKTWSTIDLTFTNPAATALDSARGWHIDNGSSFGSDHLALCWTINYGAVEVENITGERYNFKDMDPAKWRDAFRDTLLTHTEALDPLQRTRDTLTTDELDATAHALTEAMQEASAKAAKVRKPSDHTRPWWNQGLQDAAKKISDL